LPDKKVYISCFLTILDWPKSTR